MEGVEDTEILTLDSMWDRLAGTGLIMGKDGQSWNGKFSRNSDLAPYIRELETPRQPHMHRDSVGPGKSANLFSPARKQMTSH